MLFLVMLTQYKPFSIFEAQVVGRDFVHMLSLIAIGAPSMGPNALPILSINLFCFLV